MMDEKQTLDKLKETAEDFMAAVNNRNYMRAKALYNKALIVATFMQISGEDMAELFGQNAGIADDEEAPDGLFQRAAVNRVDLECCIKRNKAYEDQTCRRIGTQVRFYSEDDYCSRCEKGKKIAGRY